MTKRLAFELIVPYSMLLKGSKPRYVDFQDCTSKFKRLLFGPILFLKKPPNSPNSPYSTLHTPMLLLLLLNIISSSLASIVLPFSISLPSFTSLARGPLRKTILNTTNRVAIAVMKISQRIPRVSGRKYMRSASASEMPVADSGRRS